MLTNWHGALEIVLRTTIIYVLVLVGIRLTGKREVGQMTPFDLTLLLLLSNSVQNAMTGPDTSLVGGIVAAVVLLVLNYILAEVSGVNRRFRKLIQGSPSLLVHNGEVVTAHMAKEHVSMDELNRAFREHGCVDAKDVALAVLEVDGSISVLKNDDIPESVNPHRRLKFLKHN
ncbi:MAG TPA: YetF domain-containing protein [Candidatus Angelobacter sp.]|nr:YetF domain-containing protein [Candidatus Angelobacter sp.]